MWNKCKEDNDESRRRAKKYAEKLMERNNRMFTAPSGPEKKNTDSRIINNKTKVRIGEKLAETMHVPHPFIMQCVHQDCCDYFKKKEKLMKHLKEKHGLGEAAVAKLEIYALTQLYHEDTIFWKDNSKTVRIIEGYWPDKKNCLFDNCKFNHLDLNYHREFNHTEYYLKEVLGFGDTTVTQIKIFNALSPVWKCMVLERFYYEINWLKSKGLYGILKPDGKLEVYEDDGLENLQVIKYDGESLEKVNAKIYSRLMEMEECKRKKK
jgi:hypothetical protein